MSNESELVTRKKNFFKNFRVSNWKSDVILRNWVSKLNFATREFRTSDYVAAFTLMNLVFLALDTYHCHLDLKLFDENNNAIIPRTLNLQLLKKDYEYVK